ncbi:MAG: helix-turn-helix transcriptional regulator [Cyclobacteriaceae bacterium]
MSSLSYTTASDKRLEQYIGDFIKHHRLQQNRSQQEVADAAGLSRSTLSLLERGEAGNIETLIRILRVLDQLHIFSTFEVNEPISPIALAKMQEAKRERARKSGSKKDDHISDW